MRFENWIYNHVVYCIGSFKLKHEIKEKSFVQWEIPVGVILVQKMLFQNSLRKVHCCLNWTTEIQSKIYAITEVIFIF